MLAIEDQKDARLAESLAGFFVQESARDVDIRLMLTPRERADLAFMGPAGHHLDRDALAAKLDTPETASEVEALFRITVFRPEGALSNDLATFPSALPGHLPCRWRAD